jgi:DNA-binding MarR family transcriptional regulator
MSGKRAAGSRGDYGRSAYRFSILAARQMRCLSEMYAQVFDLPVSQWKVLPIIGHYGPMSAKNVGERSSLEPEKVTRAVDQLVARGLVTRRPDPKDRRRVILSLAANGKQMFEESEKLRGIIEDKFLGALPPKERLAFHRILDKLEDRAAEMFDGKQAWRRIIGDKPFVQTKVRSKIRKRARED